MVLILMAVIWKARMGRPGYIFIFHRGQHISISSIPPPPPPPLPSLILNVNLYINAKIYLGQYLGADFPQRLYGSMSVAQYDSHHRRDLEYENRFVHLCRERKYTVTMKAKINSCRQNMKMGHEAYRYHLNYSATLS